MKRSTSVVISIICVLVALVSGLYVGSDPWRQETTGTTEPAATEPIVLSTAAKRNEGEPTTLVKPTTTRPPKRPADMTIIDLLPLSISGGSWDAAHCQGVTVDMKKGYAYFSFTYAFVKTDLEGNVLGSLTNITAHLGDICYNEADGKVYGAYIARKMKGFYVAIIDVDKLNRVGVNAENSKLFKTVFLKTAWEDYRADMDNNGKFDGAKANTPDHRYGCGGVDGLTFAPSFIKGKNKKNLLVIGYGMYLNEQRQDNDYQVMLQYDVKGWWKKYAKPLSYKKWHRSGPEGCYAKYFVYTGNIKFGIQTITYDSDTRNLYFTVYGTRKSGFPGYNLYVVNGSLPAKMQPVKGNHIEGEQPVLTLLSKGSHHAGTGIYGYNFSYGNMGLQALGNGYFYVCHAGMTAFNSDMALAYLYKWTGNRGAPFSLAVGS